MSRAFAPVMKAIHVLGIGMMIGACAPSSSPSSSQEGAFTSERSAPAEGDVPAYTSEDAPPSFGARVRVSFGGGAVSESETTASYGGQLSPEMPRPWALGVGMSPAHRPVFLYFGKAGAKQIQTGTFSCADGDAAIFEAEWNSDGSAKPARNASECTATIDAVDLGPGRFDDYARVHGRFRAKSALPDGLSTDLTGAFVADFPVGSE